MTPNLTDTIETSNTLAEIINRDPGLARELERRSLDYCCHGQRSLADACAEVGLDAQAIASELSELGSVAPEPWAELEPAALVDHIESIHHSYLHEEMPRLSALAAKVAEVHGGRHPELIAVRDTYEQLRAELDPHLMKEERVLFPAIRSLAGNATDDGAIPAEAIGQPIAVILSEHDSAGELLEQLRELSGAYQVPADGCASYNALYAGLEEFETDTHLHIHKENNLLFPAVRELAAQS